MPFFAFDPPTTPLSTLMRPAVWGNIVFLSVFASLMGFVVWAHIVKRIGPIKASNWLYIQPIITLIASAIILSEKLTIVGIVGCSLILFGVWLSDYLGRRSVSKSRETDRA